MKVIIMGGTKGNVDIVNQHLEASNADLAICTGDLGIFYRGENFKALPKTFIDNQFPNYIEGLSKFIKPVCCVRGAHDNLSLCKNLLDGKIKIPNFQLIPDGETVSINKLVIGGIGGSYSPKHDEDKKLIGNARRHFNHNQMNSLLKKKGVHMIVLHDLIGNCSKKSIQYSEDTYRIMNIVNPNYIFVGKYHWWGYSKLPGANVVIVPFADKGYLSVDTETWDAEGIRFDIDIGRN